MKSLLEKTLRPGEKWSGNISRGKLLRFTAMGNNANTALLMYNSKDLSERYNMPDTLKAQYTSMLTKGNILMSDNGRVMASILEDSMGWNDTISGILTAEQVGLLFGNSSYQTDRNEWLQCGYQNFGVELVRNGLDLRDLVSPVNLFSKVNCDEAGNMHYIKDHCKKGDVVMMRIEMDILLILSNTPNPLTPEGLYPKVEVKIEMLEGAKMEADDFCFHYRDENQRAFENTWDYYKLID